MQHSHLLADKKGLGLQRNWFGFTSNSDISVVFLLLSDLTI